MTTHERVTSHRVDDYIWNEIDHDLERFDHFQKKIYLLRALNAHIKTIHPEDNNYDAITNHFAAWKRGVLLFEPIPTNDADYSPGCPYRVVENR